MNALQALSDTNLKVSEARALLSELEESETKYLAAREKKAMERITVVLRESRELIEETKANYDEVQRFHQTVSSFADFLKEGHTRFKEILTIFSEKEAEWSSDMERQEAELVQMKKILSVERTKIANDKKSIEFARKEIENGNKKLQDERGTLERAIIRLNDKQI